jgi:hypothetical protein
MGVPVITPHPEIGMVRTEGYCHSCNGIRNEGRKYKDSKDNDEKIICFSLRKGEVGEVLLHFVFLGSKINIFCFILFLIRLYK